jgi:fibronectin type 3 domain-containing protein
VVILLWAAPAETDVSGYKIHRQEVGAGDRVALQSSLITTLSYRDETVQSGKSYEYDVAAVDGNGNEGTPAKIRVTP